MGENGSVILGFDLSTRHIGVARCRRGVPEPQYLLECYEISLQEDDYDQRFSEACSAIKRVLDGSEFDVVAMEDGFVGLNSMTSLKLGEFRGALKGLVWSCAGCPLVAVSPTRAKRAATGRGSATKSQVMRIVRVRFGLNTIGEHAADAIGVCLAADVDLRQEEIHLHGGNGQ